MFVIRNEKGEYLVWIHPSSVAWTTRLAEARTFPSQAKADAFLNNRKKTNQVSPTASFSVVDPTVFPNPPPAASTNPTSPPSAPPSTDPASPPNQKQDSVLIHDGQGQYLVWQHPNQLSWSTDVSQAKSFKNQQAAQGFLNAWRKQLQNKTGIALIPATQARSHPLSSTAHASTEAVPSSNTATVSPPAALTVLTAPTAIPLLPPVTGSSPLPTRADSADPVQPEPAPADPFAVDEWETVLQRFADSLDTLLVLAQYAPTAQAKCLREMKRADLETEDLLHKIEFTRADVVKGYHLYQMLHECRLRRRQAKDRADFLQMMQDADILQLLRTMSESYHKYQNHLQTRTYRPRIRDDLF